ncbi:MAG: DUF721 domain-containing protein [Muribaculaceae bacterium]
MKRVEPTLLKDILEQAFHQCDDNDNFDRQRAAYLWIDVVGPGVNRYTTRRYVDGETLHVYISSASLKNELSFHRETIVRRLNELVGKDVLKEIILH